VSRGGKREGAGRKPKLNHTERIRLGSLCETRFQGLWAHARQKRWEERPGVSELHQLQSRFRSIRTKDRKSFRLSAEGRELSEDVEFSIREIRQTPDFVEETNRFFTLTAPRPKSVKAGICEALAREFGEKWNLPELGPRYVQRCWDEYRAFEKEDDPDTD
jgi:hypothetical protein